MASSADSNVKRHARIVYNSNFANINLFDRLYIQKLKSLCRNVKKNVLFSDIVKSSVKLNCINASGQTSTLPGCGTSTRSVNRSHQTVNKEQGRNSYQSGNESCNTIHQRINVNSFFFFFFYLSFFCSTYKVGHSTKGTKQKNKKKHKELRKTNYN